MNSRTCIYGYPGGWPQFKEGRWLVSVWCFIGSCELQPPQRQWLIGFGWLNCLYEQGLEKKQCALGPVYLRGWSVFLLWLYLALFSFQQWRGIGNSGGFPSYWKGRLISYGVFHGSSSAALWGLLGNFRNFLSSLWKWKSYKSPPRALVVIVGDHRMAWPHPRPMTSQSLGMGLECNMYWKGNSKVAQDGNFKPQSSRFCLSLNS